MLTNSQKKKKVNIITLGCSKNIYDSNLLKNQFLNNNYEVVSEEYDNKSDFVIINTCGFINSAKEESINTILTFVKAKKENKIKKLIVTGCLSERYKNILKKEIPEVDNFFGTNDFSKIVNALNADYKKDLTGEKLLYKPSHFSYLKISEGCNRKCSFCAIPLMRGKHISKPIEKIVKEAKLLVSKGVKELILIAQDLTYYGLDLYKKRALYTLLMKLSEIEKLEWIRLHYVYPSDFPLEILDAINESNKICNYLDVPFQHISDNVLKSMRRGINKEKTNKLIDIIRNKVPTIALRTTIMVGFPTETEKNFEELCKWIEKTKFDRLGVFTYSHEENTYAYKLKDIVKENEKIKRANKIMQIQKEISYKKNQKKIGEQLKILIDEKQDKVFIGRSYADSPEIDNEVFVNINNKKNNKFKTGDFINVKITGADEYDLYGDII